LEFASLPALPNSAACQVYLGIHPEARSDPQMDSLLDALGGMPLAIILMARLGKNTEAMPGELLKEWNNPNIGTGLLDDGSQSKTRNINFSIRLSIESHYLQSNPIAITLLAILSMLPGGARRDFLPGLAPDISIPRALDTLTKSSLVEIWSTTSET
jgi:hypothetical protein